MSRRGALWPIGESTDGVGSRSSRQHDDGIGFGRDLFYLLPSPLRRRQRCSMRVRRIDNVDRCQNLFQFGHALTVLFVREVFAVRRANASRRARDVIRRAGAIQTPIPSRPLRSGKSTSSLTNALLIQRVSHIVPLAFQIRTPCKSCSACRRGGERLRSLDRPGVGPRVRASPEFAEFPIDDRRSWQPLIPLNLAKHSC